MLKAVIFDVDGTLLNSERIYMRAWKEAGKLYGYDIPEIALKETRATSKPVAKASFRHYCGQEFPYDEMLVDRIRISEVMFQKTDPRELRMPHAEQALQWLKEQGISVAVASTTVYEKTCAHLEHAQLLDRFQAVVGGDMVEHGKPEPDIFLKAAQMLGVDPRDCVVVGDTPADVLAANAAGIPMILIPDQVPANEQTAAMSWRILADLSQLPAALEELL